MSSASASPGRSDKGDDKEGGDVLLPVKAVFEDDGDEAAAAAAANPLAKPALLLSPAARCANLEVPLVDGSAPPMLLLLLADAPPPVMLLLRS